MGRLIDADVVEDTLKKCVNDAYKRRDAQCATGVSLAILQLRNIPTAYDVEGVVEEVQNVRLPLASQKARIIGIIRKGGVE